MKIVFASDIWGLFRVRSLHIFENLCVNSYFDLLLLVGVLEIRMCGPLGKVWAPC